MYYLYEASKLISLTFFYSSQDGNYKLQVKMYLKASNHWEGVSLWSLFCTWLVCTWIGAGTNFAPSWGMRSVDLYIVNVTQIWRKLGEDVKEKKRKQNLSVCLVRCQTCFTYDRIHVIFKCNLETIQILPGCLEYVLSWVKNNFIHCMNSLLWKLNW